jgi:DNA-directed RNA polymerase specialized sigma24 family protein
MVLVKAIKVHLVGRYSNPVELTVEVSGQLSNQEIRERINALWSLTRDNVSATSWAHNSLVSEPALRTSKRVCRRLDPAKVEELIQGFVDGVPVDELAARFQVDQSTVQKHARRHGLPRRSSRLGADPSEEAARLYLAGQSFAKLAKHFGVATDTVALALRRAGVALRPRRGWPR